MVKVQPNFTNNLFTLSPDNGEDLHWAWVENQIWENAMQFYDSNICPMSNEASAYSPCGTDVVFSCKDGKKAYAHRMILNSVPYLKSILDGAGNIQDAFGLTVLVFPDVEVNNILTCLGWIYNRRVIGDEIDTNLFDTNASTLKDVFGIEIEASADIMIRYLKNAQGAINLEQYVEADSEEQHGAPEKINEMPSKIQIDGANGALEDSKTKANVQRCHNNSIDNEIDETRGLEPYQDPEIKTSRKSCGILTSPDFIGFSTSPNENSNCNRTLSIEKKNDILEDEVENGPSSSLMKRISKSGGIQLPVTNEQILKDAREKICHSIKYSKIASTSIENNKRNDDLKDAIQMRKKSLRKSNFDTSRRDSLRKSSLEAEKSDGGISQKATIIESKKRRLSERISTALINKRTKADTPSKMSLTSPCATTNVPNDTKTKTEPVSPATQMPLFLCESQPAISTPLNDADFAYVCPECKSPLQKSLFWRHFTEKHLGKKIDPKSLQRIPLNSIAKSCETEKIDDVIDSVINEITKTGEANI